MKTLFTALTVLALGANEPAQQVAATAPVVEKSLLTQFAPLAGRQDEPSNPTNDQKIKLGRMLFFEARLSKNHDVSCNSCHDLKAFGVDGKPFSQGHKKQLGGRNAPTVYNAGKHLAQFWDGRASTLEEQAKGPIENPVEMAATAEQVVKTLQSMPEYVDLFKKAFPEEKEPLTFDNAAKAIAAFERGLVTPGRFDKFLQGDQSALTVDEQKGLKLFVEAGCATCHNGPAVGGSSFQKLGLVVPYPDQTDLGRFNATKAEEDKMKFRVPSLRNIAKTAPYFHHSKYKTLEEAVTVMGKHQLGRTFTEPEVKSLVTFLNALTGELPVEYIKKPALPKKTAATPKPNPG